MKLTTVRYGNLLMLSTVQFEGHFREYFVRHARKVVALYILPRLGDQKNFFEVYQKGKLMERRDLPSSKQLLLFYLTLYASYVWILFRYFPEKQCVYFINFIPQFFVGNALIRRLKNIRIVYWIGDYWPMSGFLIRMYRWLMHYYHDRAPYAVYLSNRLNRVMNKGRLVHLPHRHTVAWAIKPARLSPKASVGRSISLCFIGVLVTTQGVDLLLSLIARYPEYKLTIIGTGQPALVKLYRDQIRKYGIEGRVRFPNQFFYGKKLRKWVRDCHIGMALYSVDKNSTTYYADPAKVKQYVELGLPVIMTNAAEVSRDIRRLQAGIIVERSLRSVRLAIELIRRHYPSYRNGVSTFSKYFNYETYYAKRFRFLEKS